MCVSKADMGVRSHVQRDWHAPMPACLAAGLYACDLHSAHRVPADPQPRHLPLCGARLLGEIAGALFLWVPLCSQLCAPPRRAVAVLACMGACRDRRVAQSCRPEQQSLSIQ